MSSTINFLFVRNVIFSVIYIKQFLATTGFNTKTVVHFLTSFLLSRSAFS